MKAVSYKIKIDNKEIILNLMTFKKSDRKFLKTFNLWKKINKIITKIKGTRKLNLPMHFQSRLFVRTRFWKITKC